MLFKEFALERNYTVVKDYIDDGWTSDILARPALDQLRQDAKKKIWDAVLVYDPDRIARRYSYQELVTDELREAGAQVIFITVEAPKNSEDKILFGVRGLFAEYERAKITERFRLGKLRKIKEGHLLVSEALYGYSYIPKADTKHGYYEINPSEARVVKMIFGWVADERLTLRKVVKRLQGMGIPPRKSKRGVWSTSTLTHLLRNKGYTGESHWGSTYAVVPENPLSKEKYRRVKKSSRRAKPEEEWFTIPIPPIIDKVLFTKARAQMEENFKLNKRNTVNQYLLSNRVYCECGKRRCGEGPQHGRYLYYRCNDRVNSFPLTPSCGLKGVNARVADAIVWDKVTELMCSPGLLTAQLSRWLESRQAAGKSAVVDTGAIEKELEKTRNEEDRYNRAYAAGLFTLEKLGEYLLPLRARLKSLSSQIELCKSKENEAPPLPIPDRDEIEAFSIKAEATLQNLSFEAKRDIILNTVEKVVASPKKLQVYGYIPITADNDVALSSNHRHGMNATRHNHGGTAAIPFEFGVSLNNDAPNVSDIINKQ